MAETLEIIISAVIFLSIFAGFYHKFLRGKLRLPTSLVSAPPATVSSWISAKFAAAKKDPLSAVVYTLVLLGIVYGVFSYWQNNVAGPGKEFGFSTQAEFQQNFDQVSGNWQVSGNCLRGSGEIRLKNSEAIKWRKIKISPCEKEFSDAAVKIGNYKFQYAVGEISRNSAFRAVTEKYFFGSIYYNGIELSPVLGRIQAFGDAPLPITITSDKSFVYPRSPDLRLFVGDMDVVASRSYLSQYAGAAEEDGSPVAGQISFAFKGDVGVRKIEIY